MNGNGSRKINKTEDMKRGMIQVALWIAMLPILSLMEKYGVL